MEPPLRANLKYVLDDGTPVDLGEFNLRWNVGNGSKVTAADEYTLMTKDAAVLKGHSDEVTRGRLYEWNIQKTGETYQYMVVSDFDEALQGWVMQRVDDMPRTEPRHWTAQGDPVLKAADRLAAIQAANDAEISAARAVKGAAAPAIGNGPRVMTVGLPTHQALLVFSCEDDRDSFLGWFSDKGSDLWREAVGAS